MTLHRNASAEALGMGRICVYGIWLVLVAATPGQWYADVPYELFRPWGPLLVLPDVLYQAALTPAFLIGFKTALMVMLALLVVGVRPFAPLAILTFAMLLLFDGVMKGWQGTMNHAQGVALYAAMILPLFPAADGLSVLDRRRSPAGSPEAGGTERYSAGLLAVALVLCITYSLTGVRRVALGGIDVFTGDAVLASMALRSLEYGPFAFDYGLLPLTAPWLAVTAKIGFVVVTIFEMLSPLVLISRSFRYTWVAVIGSFHFATLFTMNIFFWENVVLILVFATGAAHLPARQRSKAPRPAPGVVTSMSARVPG